MVKLIQQRAFSVLEAVVVLSLLAIIAGFSMVGLGQTVQSMQAQQLQSQLYQTLQFARDEAMSQAVPVTVSPLKGDWCQGWTVFKDPLLQGGFSSQEKELNYQPVSAAADCKISLQAFPQHDTLSYLPSGSTNFQNGHFTYQKGANIIWQVVVSQTGRVRVGVV